MNVEIMIYLFMGGFLCFVFVLIWHIKSAEKAGLTEHSHVSSANDYSSSARHESFTDKDLSYRAPTPTGRA